jgi:hypothetical protein
MDDGMRGHYAQGWHVCHVLVLNEESAVDLRSCLRRGMQTDPGLWPVTCVFRLEHIRLKRSLVLCVGDGALIFCSVLYGETCA